jgi:hypothetical protein
MSVIVLVVLKIQIQEHDARPNDWRFVDPKSCSTLSELGARKFGGKEESCQSGSKLSKF